jgi:hypothetical protein
MCLFFDQGIAEGSSTKEGEVDDRALLNIWRQKDELRQSPRISRSTSQIQLTSSWSFI